MKHVRHFVFATLMLIVAVPVWAYDFEVDGIYYNITSNTIPYAVEVTRDGSAFSLGNGCYSGEVVIPQSVSYGGKSYVVTRIGNDAFSWCRDLVSVIIPNSVNSIGKFAFYYYTGITSIVIPNSVTSIEDEAFELCFLTSIHIPYSVTNIGRNPFGHCESLTTITVDSNNPKYDSRGGCNAIIETESNTLISGCKTTTIPNSVTIIGSFAFSGIQGLTSITIPNSVTRIGQMAFYWCRITSLIIPNSVTDIEEHAFQRISVSSINIPYSVTNIGRNPFYECYSLTSITVDLGNPKYDSRSNCNAIIEKETNTLISGCNTTTIPNSVTTIGKDAFGHFDGITTLVIPNSVMRIERAAFAGCHELTSITMSNSLTYIGEYAFLDCRSITSIVIPKLVTIIDPRAFQGCTNLSRVIVKATTPPSLYSSSFPSQIMQLFVPCGHKEVYENTSNWSNFSSIIENDFTYEVSVRSSNENYGSTRITQLPSCEDRKTVVEAEPLGEYLFVHWSANGQVVSMSNPYIFVVNDDVELVAHFSGVGIDEDVENKIAISPNPAKDHVNIECENMKSIKLYTMDGKIARTYELNTDAVTLDLTDISKGVYVLRIETREGVIIKRKIIKE